MVVVAQLVEPRFVVPVVVGSSPIDHPRSKKSPNRETFLYLGAIGEAIEGRRKSFGQAFVTDSL